MHQIMLQKTLKDSVSCSGIGVHSGETVQMALKPAAEDTGFTFIRTDITDKNNVIPGRWDHVVDTQLCTVLSNEDQVTISTVEHVLSALTALGIDNAIIEIDAPEIPIMDGSAIAFVDLIDSVGLQTQAAPKKFLQLNKDVTYTDGDKSVTLRPSAKPSWSMKIDFDAEAIGIQTHTFDNREETYRSDIAMCRTFCRFQDVEYLQSIGLILGGSLDNAIVVDGAKVLNPEGTRVETEFVRHKILDAVGDFILAGAPVLADYNGVKAGHDMNNKALRAVFADPANYTFITADRLASLPKPARPTKPVLTTADVKEVIYN